jgi:hypothetical protein
MIISKDLSDPELIELKRMKDVEYKDSIDWMVGLVEVGFISKEAYQVGKADLYARYTEWALTAGVYEDVGA